MTDSLQTLDVLGTAAAACLRDGRVAIATIIDTWGSAPVPVGGQMVIDTNGAFQGSVSGGCVEGDVIAEAMELLETGGGRRVL
ncbi:MAG TPA: XdhC family protein, partial [Hyphomicrobiaceae bacterium]|nr:XdhC family protein [Hyphomicrobiaceae bacterium]